MEVKHPVPPFTAETAQQKVQLAEDAWNSKDPIKVSMAYSEDTEWRNRNLFINGREEVQAFLANKWDNEIDYKLKKELWSYTDNKIGVRFEYEYRNKNDQWFRAYGNEMWEFDPQGFMKRRFASINDLEIEEKDRKFKQ